MDLGRSTAVAALLSFATSGLLAQSPSKLTVPGTSVTASSDDGNVPANTVDGSLSTRWSAQGDGQWIRYDLGASKTVSYVKIAWHQGNVRTATFDVQTSTDATAWSTVFSGTSSGTTTALETYDFTDVDARYVRIVGHGNSSGNGWNSITETEIWGIESGGGSGGSVPFSVEAESVAFDSAYWSSVSDAAASAGVGLRELVSITGSPPSGGGLLFPFTLGSSSTIYLQIKARADDGSSDSCWVRLDSGGWQQFVFDSTGVFTWRNKAFSSVASGSHVFEIRCREADAVLDQVAVTLDTNPPSSGGGGSATMFTIPASAVTASTYDSANNAVPANAVDGNLSTRWSGQGDGAYITFDLGASNGVHYVKIAWYQGDTRTSTFDVQLSADGTSFSNVFSGTSSGSTTALETVDFADANARFVRIVGHGNSTGNGWNSITEIEVWGAAGNQVAAPTFTPPGGVYGETQVVTITTATSGATIRYTTDGSEPSSSGGAVYSGAITIDATTTLKAIAYNSGMTDSTVTSALYTISTCGGGLNPGLPPGGNFDLSHWKITLPINDAEEHSAAELTAGYEHPDYFYTDPVTGGMVFMAPNLGDTTGGSSYTRSELREMLAPTGSATAPENNWVVSTSSTAAKNAAGGVDGTMRATLTVDHASVTGDETKVGRVIVGQIHAPDSEVIRLYYHKRPDDARGAIYFGHDTPANSNSYHAIIGDPDNLDPADGILLGELWSYEINVVGLLMTVRVTPENRPTVTVTFTLESGYNDLSQYFKAGVYNQNNTGSAEDFAQATFYCLTHTHP